MDADTMKTFALSVTLICVGLIVGWVAGSAFPIALWSHSDCHRLGGGLRVIAGPGKPTECVIPWDDH